MSSSSKFLELPELFLQVAGGFFETLWPSFGHGGVVASSGGQSTCSQSTFGLSQQRLKKFQQPSFKVESLNLLQSHCLVGSLLLIIQQAQVDGSCKAGSFGSDLLQSLERLADGRSKPGARMSKCFLLPAHYELAGGQQSTALRTRVVFLLFPPLTLALPVTLKHCPHPLALAPPPPRALEIAAPPQKVAPCLLPAGALNIALEWQAVSLPLLRKLHPQDPPLQSQYLVVVAYKHVATPTRAVNAINFILIFIVT